MKTASKSAKKTAAPTAREVRARWEREPGPKTETPDLESLDPLIHYEGAEGWRVGTALVTDKSGRLWEVFAELPHLSLSFATNQQLAGWFASKIASGTTSTVLVTPDEAVEWYVEAERYGTAQYPNLDRFLQILVKGGAR